MVTPDIAAIERLGHEAAESAEALQMDEDVFRAFYERTARPVWAYLSRVTGSGAMADDLLQDAYYRLLRSRVAFENEAHRRNYLFRIATNLAHDRRRQIAAEARAIQAEARGNTAASGGDRHDKVTDVRRVMARLKPRERAMLWLAYAEGSSHEEIAIALGVRAGSVRVMLHRARTRFRRLLGFGDADGTRRGR